MRRKAWMPGSGHLGRDWSGTAGHDMAGKAQCRLNTDLTSLIRSVRGLRIAPSSA